MLLLLWIVVLHLLHTATTHLIIIKHDKFSPVVRWLKIRITCWRPRWTCWRHRRPVGLLLMWMRSRRRQTYVVGSSWSVVGLSRIGKGRRSWKVQWWLATFVSKWIKKIKTKIRRYKLISMYPKNRRFRRSMVVALAIFDFEDDKAADFEAFHQEEVDHSWTWT